LIETIAFTGNNEQQTADCVVHAKEVWLIYNEAETVSRDLRHFYSTSA